MIQIDTNDKVLSFERANLAKNIKYTYSYLLVSFARIRILAFRF